jgi:peptidoglycan/xylan/chitin deacetylase (PgdA/CDA1 family)
MGKSYLTRAVVGVSMLALGACATTEAPAPRIAPEPAAAPTPGAAPRAAPAPRPLPEAFESDDFVVTFARSGDTPQTLAAKYLGDPGRAWMIEDFNDTATLTAGQEVVIPRRSWNPAGVYPSGYQLVPILVYHNLAPQSKGRMVMAAKLFEEQMRYLKAQGYHVMSLKDFFDFGGLKRQVPRKSVILTFDDGYRSFLEYAHPILRELGFTATLFIYTDYVAAGRNSLTWEEIKRLEGEGFDIGAHSKTHDNLRRKVGEADAAYARRLQGELSQALFQRHLGRSLPAIAYPFGATDDEVIQKAREAGYLAAFTVRRQGNASFTNPYVLNRSQIYPEMSLEDFAKNLNTFNQEAIR